MTKIKEIHIINALWNIGYAKEFLDLSLPTTLTSGNIPFLKSKIKVSYKLYTDNETKSTLENHPNFIKLSELIDTQIIAIDLLTKLDKYDRMTQYYSFGFQEANKSNAGIIILTPDCIFSNNSFKNLYSHIIDNKRVVFTSGLRISQDDYLNNLRPYYQSTNMLEKALNPRFLLNITLKYLHPFAKISFADNKKISAWPSTMYWKINENCLLNRAFHVHPLFIWPVNKNISLVEGTFDTEFPVLCCPDIHTWKVIEDSDEILILGLTEKKEIISHTINNTPVNIAKWVVSNNKYFNYNLHLFKHKIIFHSQDLDIDSVKKNIIKSDLLFSSIKNLLKEKKKEKKSAVSVFNLLFFFFYIFYLLILSTMPILPIVKLPIVNF
ncbi:MAG: hypothetical protein K940chlam1_01127 [Candidatus Anoxychlamydiales bacterium]|nr:hypothetical protein [Candidatus Anoxychlamydiales bacterium]NGX35220.1 hypothetical protein [Candidatus Anoxychlamydiales bacterium]